MTSTKMKVLGVALGLVVLGLGGCQQGFWKGKAVAERVKGRDCPSVFQAWNPIDMKEKWPLGTLEGRLQGAAKHDVLWEEPVSQLGYGVDLVLGAVWDSQHGGLARGFTQASREQALANRRKMLALNPRMVFLMEVRWRDAPGSFLPEDSPFWRRGKDGKRVTGWMGGPEPYYLLDPDNEAFAANIARQCKASIESGVYDGVMLDWSGYLPIVQKVREAIGEKGLIIVNIHDDIPDGKKYQDYINGSFMECNPTGPGCVTSDNPTTWAKLREGLLYFEANFRSPRVNCLEVWGDRKDFRRMRATTTLGLTHSNGSVLYADPNPLKTPDHLHDWYAFWDAPLGRPAGGRIDRADGAYQREFSGGTAVYNPVGNKPALVKFDAPRQRASDGSVGKEFTVQDADGDIFLPAK